MSNGYASHRQLHRGQEGKYREGISRPIFFLDTIFTRKCGLQIFQIATILLHTATQCCIHNILTWISRMVLLTSIRGGDLKTISPGDYITCQSSLQDRKLSPHFGIGGRRGGTVEAYCSLSTFIECTLFCWFIFQYEFLQKSAKIKPVQKKNTPTLLLLCSLWEKYRIAKRLKNISLLSEKRKIKINAS